jgi:hypothetical protein
MASFALLGDWGIGKSSLLFRLAATCSEPNFRMLPVTLSISKDILDYMKFAEALCDRLANTLLASDSLATRLRAEIENWKLTKISVRALTIDRQNRRYFLSSGSTLLRHALIEAWEHFIRPNYAGAIFFLDDLHNLAAPTVQDTALIIRDQFQSLGIEGVNLSVCFTAKRDYFSGIRSFAEPAVRFYNKCVLEPFTLEETAEYASAVFGTTTLNPEELAEWLFSKTHGHPYFLAFISRELWSHYHSRQFANAAQLWPVVFSRLEQGKFNNDLAQLSEKEVGLLRAIAHDDHEESNPAPFAQKFPHIYFKRLADKGLLIRAGRGRYKLYHPLFRQFLRQQERAAGRRAQGSNHNSYSNSTQKVPGRRPGTALTHRADSLPLAICPPYPFPFFH